MLRVARRVIAMLLTTVLALAAAAVGTGAVLARLDKVRFATVLSGSMEPAIPTGAVIAGTPLDGGDVEVGDVVMFLPPAPYSTPGGKPIVHRVTQVNRDRGVLEVNTQGDANSNPDAWTLNAGRTTFYEFKAQSLQLGMLVQKAPDVSVQFLWTVPVLALMFQLLRSIWRPEPSHAN